MTALLAKVWRRNIPGAWYRTIDTNEARYPHPDSTSVDRYAALHGQRVAWNRPQTGEYVTSWPLEPLATADELWCRLETVRRRLHALANDHPDLAELDELDDELADVMGHIGATT